MSIKPKLKSDKMENYKKFPFSRKESCVSTRVSNSTYYYSKVIIIFLTVIIGIVSYKTTNCQVVTSVVPDSGAQGQNFPVTVNGHDTFWSFSSYFEIYFEPDGVYAPSSFIVIVNDTTLSAQLYVNDTAFNNYRKIIVSDAFLNLYTKDSAFRVLLSIPVPPILSYPLNNATNIPTNTVFGWDTNLTVATYRLQISNDSIFTNTVFDTIGILISPYQLTSNILIPYTKYYWRVKAGNIIGTSNWSLVRSFTTGSSGISTISSEFPDRYILFDNFPNPFNPTTNIDFQIPKTSFVKLSVYDMLGREISVLINQQINTGKYRVSFSAEKLASGIYFYKMETSEFSSVKRMVLIR